MSSLALIAFLLYLGQCLSDPRNCTTSDLCLPVNANVCDDSKCLLLNQSEIDEFTSVGLLPYKWNIDVSTFPSSCSFKYHHETSVAPDGTATAYIVFTFTTGSSCNESVSMKYVTEEHNDSTGRLTLNKRIWHNSTFEECYLYYEPGVAIVMRSCLVDSSYQYGQQACAAIYADVRSDLYGETKKLDHFLDGLGVDFLKIKSDCV